MSEGFVVRLPQPGFMHGAMAALGKSRFDDLSDNDELAQKALADGRLKAEWSFVSFDADSLPTPRKVPGLVVYGESNRDTDRVLTYTDKFDHPTWHTVRKGRRPTVFASHEVAKGTAEEHLETATEFGIPVGNLKFFQVVPVAEWETTAQNDPKDKIARRKTSIELARAKREQEAAAEKTAALEAELSASKPVSTGDWTGYGVPNVQKRLTADGSEYFRGRVSGKASPTYETEADAVAWVEEQKALA